MHTAPSTTCAAAGTTRAETGTAPWIAATECAPRHPGARAPFHRHVGVKVHVRHADDHLSWPLGAHDVHVVLHEPQLRPPALFRAVDAALPRLGSPSRRSGKLMPRPAKEAPLALER